MKKFKKALIEIFTKNLVIKILAVVLAAVTVILLNI